MRDLPETILKPNANFKQVKDWVKEQPYEGLCDGCAQSLSECLCDIDLEEVLDCASVFHPGCRKCEDKR